MPAFNLKGSPSGQSGEALDKPLLPARDKPQPSTDNGGLYVGPEDAQRHQVQGEIAIIKTSRVNGNDHLVVGLKQPGAETLAVDLGPAEKLQGKQIEVGKTLAATGVMEKIGDKKLLVADSVRVGNEPVIQLERTSGLTLAGNIVDVTNTKIGSADHYMAIVDVNGERQLIDLGPTTFYKVQLEPKAEIKVQGVPVLSHNHRVIMASRVWLGNEVVSINRTNTFTF